jgi:hypothetical protein
MKRIGSNCRKNAEEPREELGGGQKRNGHVGT